MLYNIVSGTGDAKLSTGVGKSGRNNLNGTKGTLTIWTPIWM